MSYYANRKLEQEFVSDLQDFRHENAPEDDQQPCAHCLGSGVVETQNGPDDFQQDFCSCAEGQRLEEVMTERIAAVPDPRYMFINGYIRELL